MSLLRKFKCATGNHELSSYSQELDFDGAKMIKGDEVEAFMELAALRCKHCNYTYKAKTPTDWSIVDEAKADKQV